MLVLLSVAAVAVSLSASWLLVSRLERLGERAGFSVPSAAGLALAAAVHEEETELAEAIRPSRGTWRDAAAAVMALAAVVGASTVMEVAVTAASTPSWPPSPAPG